MPTEQPPNITPLPVCVIPTQRQLSLVRFSPCGRFLFGAGRDAQIWRWQLDAPLPASPAEKTPEQLFPALAPLTGHNGWVTHFAFRPTPSQLASVDSWGQLSCWNDAMESPQPVWTVNDAHNGWIRQVAYSPDGESIATCGADRAIRLWSAADGKKLHEFGNPSQDVLDDVFSIAFHPDGQSLVSGDLKGQVKHWDLATRSVIRQFDAQLLYMLSRIQDVGGVRVLGFDTDGKTLAIAGTQPSGGGFVEGTPVLRLVNWLDGKESQTLLLGDKTDGFVLDLAYHPDGFWMGVCSGQPGKGRYFFHRLAEPQPFLNQPLANCHSVALHPQCTRFAVISNAGTFGQSKSMAREGIYPGNSSPVHLFEIPPTAV